MKAIALDEESIFSRIFLTYFYYDNQRYSDSLATNCATDCLKRDKLPRWWCCNMLELQLCCLIMLKEISNPEVNVRLRQLREIVWSIEIEEGGDFDDAAFPHQFLKLLERNVAFTSELDGDLLAWLNRTQ